MTATYLLWCECWPGSHMDVDVRWPSEDQCGETMRPRHPFLNLGPNFAAPETDAPVHDAHLCNLAPGHAGEHVCECKLCWGWDTKGLTVDGVPAQHDYDTGRMCTWLEWLVENLGWDEVVRVGEDGDDVSFCLKYGIAPGQPFLVLFHGYTSTGRGEDFDEEWQTTVMLVEPWSPERVLRAWEEWLAEGCEDQPWRDDSFAAENR